MTLRIIILTNLFMNSPKLEVLYFFWSLRHGGYSGESPSESPPDCLLSLKRISFSRFVGRTFEPSLVRYILEHALVLEKMTIDFDDYDIDTEFTPQMQREEISHYLKGSSSCQLQFGESMRSQSQTLLASISSLDAYLLDMEIFMQKVVFVL